MWLKNLNMVGLERFSPEHLYTNYRVCSEHFEECMFANICRDKLKRNAFPNIIAGPSKRPQTDDLSVLPEQAQLTAVVESEPQAGCSKATGKI